MSSALVADTLAAGNEVIAKPWPTRNAQNPALFSKSDFKINLRNKTITCPGGEVEHATPGALVNFKPEACTACTLRAQCTNAAPGAGRSVQVAVDEAAQKRFRRLQQTGPGRARLRARVGVEHKLGRVARRQGPRARYRGVRKNLFDLRRTCALGNLEVVQARLAA